MCCSLLGARGVCAGGSEAPRPLVSRAHDQGDFRLAGSSALALLRCSSHFMGSQCVATAAGEPGGPQSPGRSGWNTRPWRGPWAVWLSQLQPALHTTLWGFLRVPSRFHGVAAAPLLARPSSARLTAPWSLLTCTRGG